MHSYLHRMNVVLSFTLCIFARHVSGYYGIRTCGYASGQYYCCEDYYMYFGVCMPCPIGHYGIECKDRCIDGYYGMQCRKKCKCRDTEICNIYIGCQDTPVARITNHSNKDHTTISEVETEIDKLHLPADQTTASSADIVIADTTTSEVKTETEKVHSPSERMTGSSDTTIPEPKTETDKVHLPADRKISADVVIADTTTSEVKTETEKVHSPSERMTGSPDTTTPEVKKENDKVHLPADRTTSSSDTTIPEPKTETDKVHLPADRKISADVVIADTTTSEVKTETEKVHSPSERMTGSPDTTTPEVKKEIDKVPLPADRTTSSSAATTLGKLQINTSPQRLLFRRVADLKDDSAASKIPWELLISVILGVVLICLILYLFFKKRIHRNFSFEQQTNSVFQRRYSKAKDDSSQQLNQPLLRFSDAKWIGKCDLFETMEETEQGVNAPRVFISINKSFLRDNADVEPKNVASSGIEEDNDDKMNSSTNLSWIVRSTSDKESRSIEDSPNQSIARSIDEGRETIIMADIHQTSVKSLHNIEEDIMSIVDLSKEDGGISLSVDDTPSSVQATVKDVEIHKEIRKVCIDMSEMGEETLGVGDMPKMSLPEGNPQNVADTTL